MGDSDNTKFKIRASLQHVTTHIRQKKPVKVNFYGCNFKRVTVCFHCAAILCFGILFREIGFVRTCQSTKFVIRRYITAETFMGRFVFIPRIINLFSVVWKSPSLTSLLKSRPPCSRKLNNFIDGIPDAAKRVR